MRFLKVETKPPKEPNPSCMCCKMSHTMNVEIDDVVCVPCSELCPPVKYIPVFE